MVQWKVFWRFVWLNNNEVEPAKKLTTEERQELLMQVLQEKGGLDMLKKWEKPFANQARQLLMEFNKVFSLEKNEMGCTDTTEHVIELTKSEPFKERFRWIAPPLTLRVPELDSYRNQLHSTRPQSHFFTILPILHKTLVTVTKVFHGCTDQLFTLSGVTFHA